MTFADLQLVEPLCRALVAQKYENPTPIQAASIPHLMHGGDLLGSAQTGTGKTASFALPVLHRIAELKKTPRGGELRALVLVPTRELAVQVSDAFRKYGKFTKAKCSVVYGGVGYGPQIKALRGGLDVLVATPGRLLDLHSEGHVNLKQTQFLILDEADRMLDMGFKKDLETVVKAMPKTRQTILFSATMPTEIAKFADRILENPKKVNVSPVKMTAQDVEEQIMFVNSENKNELLFSILREEEVERAIVFTRTKHLAERLTKKLNAAKIRAEAIHGNKTQNNRQRSLQKFRSGRVQVLVATDVAARGIDVDDITHVINYQLSNEAENYVHRIGRTGRAGKSGVAISLCDNEELGFLRDIEKLLKRKLPVNEDTEFHDAALAEKHLRNAGKPNKNRRGARSRRGGFGKSTPSSSRRPRKASGKSKGHRKGGSSSGGAKSGAAGGRPGRSRAAAGGKPGGSRRRGGGARASQ